MSWRDGALENALSESGRPSSGDTLGQRHPRHSRCPKTDRRAWIAVRVAGVAGKRCPRSGEIGNDTSYAGVHFERYNLENAIKKILKTLDPPRWKGGPSICPVANLPALATLTDLEAFIKRNGQGVFVKRLYQCPDCRQYHAETASRSPSGDSSGNSRNHKWYGEKS